MMSLVFLQLLNNLLGIQHRILKDLGLKNNAIDLLLMREFGMSYDIVATAGSRTDPADHFLIVTLCLVFCDGLEFIHLEAVLALHHLVVDGLTQRRFSDLELLDSAERAFGC